MRKKILAGILTICMTITMTPAMVFASTDSSERAPAPPADVIGLDSAAVKDHTAKVSTSSESGVADRNGVFYPSVQEAIDSAQDGDLITLHADTNESITINKRITLDLNGKTLFTTEATDTITVEGPAAIKNGYVFNLTENPSDLKSAIYVAYTAVIEDVTATISGTEQDDYQGAVVYVEGNTAFTNCEVFYDNELVSKNDYFDGVHVAAGAHAEFTSCSIETISGDCAYIDGSADLTGCYMAADSEYSSAVYLGKNAGTVNIHSGYYYGDTPLYSDTAKPVCTIYEGEFSSAYEDIPVVDGSVSGYANAFAKATVPSKNIISTPLNNWKSADNALIFNGVDAPASVKANLTAVNGQQAGYDDIKVTWTPAKGSTADGYRVNYKKGTGSYVNGKFYKGAGSRTVANLDDGYKYTFQVTPYVIINEDIFTTGTKCFSNKTKTAYTYTLKKVVLNNFSNSSSKVKVAWKNINGETGYQISKATGKTGTNIVATVATTTGTSKLINATKGKTYYYKVRAYKTVDGKKIFGPWSAVKSCKR